MLKFLGFLLLIVILLAVLKFALVTILHFTAIAICSFLVVGGFTGFLALVNIINSGTAWTLTLIAFFIGLEYNLYEVASRPAKAMSDIKEMYHTDYSPRKYDDNGNEIDYYSPCECCGNCKHNMSRLPEKYLSIYCSMGSLYHSDLNYHQTDVCRHWEYFRG